MQFFFKSSKVSLFISSCYLSDLTLQGSNLLYKRFIFLYFTVCAFEAAVIFDFCEIFNVVYDYLSPVYLPVESSGIVLS